MFQIDTIGYEGLNNSYALQAIRTAYWNLNRGIWRPMMVDNRGIWRPVIVDVRENPLRLQRELMREYGKAFYTYCAALVPSKKIMTNWHKNRDWAEYERAYLALERVHKAIAAWKYSHPILLLCYERDPKHCHGTIIRRLMLEEYARRKGQYVGDATPHLVQHIL